MTDFLLQAAVARGELTEEQARAKWTEYDKRHRNHGPGDGIVARYKRMGVSPETLGRLKEALADAGVEDDRMRGALGAMVRVVHEMRSEGDEYQMAPGLAEYLSERLDLTDAQIERIENIARRFLYSRGEDHRDR